MRRAFTYVVLAVVLLVAAAGASSAQAVTWTPDNTAVFGEADDPALSYEGVAVVCDVGTLDGATGMDSALIDDAVLDFFEPCTVAGLDATVDCGDGASTADLIAQTNDPPGGTGAFNLNPDFRCDVSVSGFCTIAFEGPANGTFLLDEGGGFLSVEVDMSATRSGSSICGPASGTGNLTAVYAWTGATIAP